MLRIDPTSVFQPFIPLVSLLFLALGASTASADQCVLRGTYPFCDGECEVGETLKQRTRCLPGTQCCATGTYALCCKADPVEPVDPAFIAFCNQYANDAVEQANRNSQMKCGLEKGNPERWTNNRADHLDWCLGFAGAYAGPTQEGSYRVVGLKDCADKLKLQQTGIITKGKFDKLGDVVNKPEASEPPPASGGGTTATVIEDVDVYKQTGGQGKIGVLRSNNKTTKVSLVEPCKDNWCHVKGARVPSGEGWVYSGTPPDFKSLQF